MGLILGKIWYKNGSTFQVSAARPYPNHSWVAPPGFKIEAQVDSQFNNGLFYLFILLPRNYCYDTKYDLLIHF